MVEQEIMSMAEEDYCGLWEIIWRLRDALSITSDDELIEIARPSVLELMNNQKILLYQRKGLLGKEEEIEFDQVEEIIARNGNWLEPPNKDSIQYLIASND